MIFRNGVYFYLYAPAFGMVSPLRVLWFIHPCRAQRNEMGSDLHRSDRYLVSLTRLRAAQRWTHATVSSCSTQLEDSLSSLVPRSHGNYGDICTACTFSFVRRGALANVRVPAATSTLYGSSARLRPQPWTHLLPSAPPT
jgi:hypothetical protein